MVNGDKWKQIPWHNSVSDIAWSPWITFGWDFRIRNPTTKMWCYVGRGVIIPCKSYSDRWWSSGDKRRTRTSSLRWPEPDCNSGHSVTLHPPSVTDHETTTGNTSAEKVKCLDTPCNWLTFNEIVIFWCHYCLADTVDWKMKLSFVTDRKWRKYD